MTDKSTIRVFDNAADVARAGAEVFVETAAESIAARGAFHTCLAGGSTPRAAYELLAEEIGRDVQWPSVRVYFGDERNVPPDHPDSNYGMARRALLARVPIHDRHVYRIPGEKDAGDAAREYDTILHDALATSANRFDLLWLGLGDDAHTASLFPETTALKVQDHWCVEKPRHQAQHQTDYLDIPPAQRLSSNHVSGSGSRQGRSIEQDTKRATQCHTFPSARHSTGRGRVDLVD